MKICHINLARSYRGGERQTELLVKGLARCGISQRVIVRRGSKLAANLSKVEAVELFQVGYPLLGQAQLTRGVDLMHVHEGKAQQLTLYHHWINKIPYIITRRIPNPPGRHPCTRTSYRRAGAVVALSQAIADSLRSYDSTISVQTIPSMVSELEVNREQLQQLQARFAGKFIVGHVGALQVRNKGQQYLIEAARLLKERQPDLHFVLVGEGEDRVPLERAAASISNLSFVGFRDNVGDYLAVFDIFVFPSVKEGLGSILLDAMSFEKPIIAARVGGIPELVKDGLNGLLIPPCDPEALADAILRLRLDKELSSRLARGGKESVKSYSVDLVTRAYIKLYQEVLRKSLNKSD